MRVNVRSTAREAKKATNRSYRESRIKREAAVFEHRIAAQWHNHQPQGKVSA